MSKHEINVLTGVRRIVYLPSGGYFKYKSGGGQLLHDNAIAVIGNGIVVLVNYGYGDRSSALLDNEGLFQDGTLQCDSYCVCKTMSEARSRAAGTFQEMSGKKVEVKIDGKTFTATID